MIRDVATLVRSFQRAEIEIIESSGMKHAPTIGEQYENLTSDLLQKGIPPEIGLQVVRGFVEGHEGALSGQIDCMLVSGEGTQIPYTASFKWPIQHVIAVFEVKKTLFGEELSDAHDQLQQVLNLYFALEEKLEKGSAVNIDPALYAYGQILGQLAPAPSGFAELPFQNQMILRTLIDEQIAPVRIVYGCEGYASEHSLRKGFRDFLKGSPKKIGLGTNALPTLIVCGDHSLVKWTSLLPPDEWKSLDILWIVIGKSASSLVKSDLD